MNLIYRMILTTLIAFPTPLLLCQEVSFYKENITMKINERSFYVTGVYQLKSTEHNKTTLLYPFPNDSLYGSVDSVYIYNITTDERIKPLRVKSNHLVFCIDFSKEPDLSIQIAYRQRLNSTHAEYILNTTLGWKRPLLKANYQLIVPNNLKIIRFSIPPQDSLTSKEETVYYWEKETYMPEKNLIFDFKKK